ncbi:hypothetical protein IID24_04000 [Patescibacteria group bacterium]|nr:hypothetical protein [Patescibacteria group bacterium]
MDEREERVKKVQEDFSERITQLVERLKAIELADGIDKNSWIFAGCIQDLEKIRTRILAYIERCLK